MLRSWSIWLSGHSMWNKSSVIITKSVFWSSAASVHCPFTRWCCCCCSMLQGVVDFDGYYLESDPCLVCNNPEVANTVSSRRPPSAAVPYFYSCSRHGIATLLEWEKCKRRKGRWCIGLKKNSQWRFWCQVGKTNLSVAYVCVYFLAKIRPLTVNRVIIRMPCDVCSGSKSKI